ncbi:hypothetical protein Gotur_031731 [Gossypium turneri]
MHILEEVLMPDANNKVHLMYFPLLANFSSVSSNSWGPAVLAVLYRELYRTTNPDVGDMGGCLTLLQSWALYRMPFLASVSHQPYVYPLVNRWSVRPGIGRSHTVPIYRLMIEKYAREGFQCSRVVSRRSSAMIVWLHPTYLRSAMRSGGGSRHE